MESRIGVLRCHYRIVGDRSRVAVPALQKLAQQILLESYGEALDQALGNDPCVYVLRSVPAHLTFANVTARAQESVAREWGERLCGAVIRTIVADNRSSGNVVRFADQGEYVAYFIRDMLEDRVWDQWFYGAFRSLRPLSKREAVKAVLEQNRTHVASILRHLGKLDALASVIALLDTDGMKWLWSNVISPTELQVNNSSIRPLFLTAVQLARRLGLWVGPEQAQGSVFTELLGLNFKDPDWKDRRELAATIVGILRRLQVLGLISSPGMTPGSGDSIETISGELDWLDSEWLAQEVRQLFTARTSPSLTRSGAPLAQSHRVLLEKIALLIREGVVSLDWSCPDNESNAAILFAALSVRHPDLERVTGATEIIQRLLECWQLVMRTGARHELVRAFEQDRLTSVVEAFPTDERRSALRAFQAIHSLQPCASEILRALVTSASSRHVAKADSGILWKSKCAGIFLLLRALQDLRLPQLATAAETSRLSDLLLSLGIVWAGKEFRDLETIDPALLLWADLSADSQPALASFESPTFMNGMLELLHDRRSIEASPVHVFETKLRERAALILSDASGTMFPLAAWLDDSKDRTEVESQLLMQWCQATDSSPLIEHDTAVRTTFDAASEELTAAWPVDVSVSLTVTLAAITGLRLWARWLPGIAPASVPYLLKNLIRRPGTIRVSGQEILVRLQPGAIDIVLEMAGYLRKMESVSWLHGRNVLFQINQESR